MSMRRFVAYFLAVSAGSTVAFASTLMGQPPPQGAAMILTPADQGLDVLPPETVRVFQALRNRPHHKPSAKVTQVALAK